MSRVYCKPLRDETGETYALVEATFPEALAGRRVTVDMRNWRLLGGRNHLSVEEARTLAATLNAAADAVEAAQEKYGATP